MRSCSRVCFRSLQSYQLDWRWLGFLFPPQQPNNANNVDNANTLVSCASAAKINDRSLLFVDSAVTPAIVSHTHLRASIDGQNSSAEDRLSWELLLSLEDIICLLQDLAQPFMQATGSLLMRQACIEEKGWCPSCLSFYVNLGRPRNTLTILFRRFMRSLCPPPRPKLQFRPGT